MHKFSSCPKLLFHQAFSFAAHLSIRLALPDAVSSAESQR
jgi:hypothetical protein